VFVARGSSAVPAREEGRALTDVAEDRDGHAARMAHDPISLCEIGRKHVDEGLTRLSS